VLLIDIQLCSAESEFIDVESDDVDSVLSVFDEITAELLKEGEVLICTKINCLSILVTIWLLL